MSLPDRLIGGCQCGACRYEAAGPPLLGYACHCLECRRHTSSAFSIAVLVMPDAIELSGPVTTWVRDDDEHRPLEALFCSLCGVRMIHHSIPRDRPSRIKVGTLDDASWFAPAAEFFVKRRFAWVDLGPDTVQCAEAAGPGESPAILDAWQRLFG